MNTMLALNLNDRLLRVVLLVSVLFGSAAVVTAADSDSRGRIDGPVSIELAVLHQTALNGSAESQYQLGELLEYGRDLPQNDLKAAYWYEKSATQDYGSAQYRLGVFYDNGWGVPVNKEKAFVLYKAAAENSIELAQHDLAIAYLQGSGTTKNLLQAYMWLRIADLNGSQLMQKHLKVVAAEMSLAEIETAKNLAKNWLEKSRQ